MCGGCTHQLYTQADRQYHRNALQHLQQLAAAVKTARAAVAAQLTARQQADHAALEASKRIQLMTQELQERAADNAERRQLLAQEEQQVQQFEQHLQQCRARAAELQCKLAELDEQAAVTQTLPLVHDISAHAVLSKMDELDIVTACQGWRLVSVGDEGETATTTLVLHLYNMFELTVRVVEEGGAGDVRVRGQLDMLPQGMMIYGYLVVVGEFCGVYGL